MSKTAVNVLIKRGFTSLRALRLVQMGYLESQKIPKGKFQLICHLVSILVSGASANTATSTPKAPVNTVTPEADDKIERNPGSHRTVNNRGEYIQCNDYQQPLGTAEDLVDKNNTYVAGASDIPP